MPQANLVEQALTDVMLFLPSNMLKKFNNQLETSGYTTWFAAGSAIRITHYDVIDDVITRKL